MTTPEEIDALRREAEELAALRADPRTPSVVRASLLRPSRLTLRRYLELEECGSPFVTGASWPPEPLDALRAVADAWAILFPAERAPEAETAAGRIAAEIRAGFATALECRWPSQPGQPTTPAPHDGAGWFARLVARICERLSMRPEQALDLPMDHALLLAAGWGLNEGMESTGEDYRDREASPPAAHATDAARGGCSGNAGKGPATPTASIR